MSDFNKKTFLLHLADIQFSSDVQSSWNALERGVMDLALIKHQSREDNCEPGTALMIGGKVVVNC